MYSLGSFVFHTETVTSELHDAFDQLGVPPSGHTGHLNRRCYEGDTRGFPSKAYYWESVVGILGGTRSSILGLDLVPITLGHGKERWRRGSPALAALDSIKRILAEIQRHSDGFGTQIDVTNEDIGHVTI